MGWRKEARMLRDGMSKSFNVTRFRRNRETGIIEGHRESVTKHTVESPFQFRWRALFPDYSHRFSKNALNPEAKLLHAIATSDDKQGVRDKFGLVYRGGKDARKEELRKAKNSFYARNPIRPVKFEPHYDPNPYGTPSGSRRPSFSGTRGSTPSNFEGPTPSSSRSPISIGRRPSYTGSGDFEMAEQELTEEMTQEEKNALVIVNTAKKRRRSKDLQDRRDALTATRNLILGNITRVPPDQQANDPGVIQERIRLNEVNTEIEEITKSLNNN